MPVGLLLPEQELDTEKKYLPHPCWGTFLDLYISDIIVVIAIVVIVISLAWTALDNGVTDIGRMVYCHAFGMDSTQILFPFYLTDGTGWLTASIPSLFGGINT